MNTNQNLSLKMKKIQLLWDFEVQTDHHIEARRPDLIIVDKEKKTCQIVDFAIPGDHRVEMKEREKGRNTKIWQENYNYYGMRKLL